jgi:hypothetical protein
MTWSGTRIGLSVLVLVAFAGIVPAGTAFARPIPAISAPAASLRCHASMTNSHPADYTSTGVKVRTVPYAGIKTVAHYRTVNHPKHGTANSRGRRTIWYYISGATPGYRVVVDVYVWRHRRKGSCSTSFTPHQ